MKLTIKLLEANMNEAKMINNTIKEELDYFKNINKRMMTSIKTLEVKNKVSR